MINYNIRSLHIPARPFTANLNVETRTYGMFSPFISIYIFKPNVYNRTYHEMILFHQSYIEDKNDNSKFQFKSVNINNNSLE